MVGIYKLTNVLNGKCYIGQSTNIERRIKEHMATDDDTLIHMAIKEYGWENFIAEIVEECTTEQLGDKERFWIKIYKSNVSGYNMTSGGESNYRKVTTSEQKAMYDLWTLGYTFAEIAEKTNRSVNSVGRYIRTLDEYDSFKTIEGSWEESPVSQYAIDGTYINTFKRPSDAYKHTGVHPSNIRSAIKLYNKTAGGFQWKRGCDTNNIEPVNKDFGRGILQYSLNFELLNTYKNSMDVYNKTGFNASTIRSHCYSGKPFAGFYWKMGIKNTSDKQQTNKYRGETKSKRPVTQYNLSGEYIKSYESIAQASRETGILTSSIRYACDDTHKIAGGFLWMSQNHKPFELLEREQYKIMEVMNNA